ncbi:hypothetical protein F4604DRAFT_2003545 [Suillus subluteus]|nr:hypothetical protein F4604DRAFT_2003545 [Suillus subluteus]
MYNCSQHPRLNSYSPNTHATIGACSCGLTCIIAICWNFFFLHGNCSSMAETCNLSHDQIPEWTPLCCLDFAEKGSCSTKGCKLPHVIHANCNRKPPAPTAPLTLDIAATASSTIHSMSVIEDAWLVDEYISLLFNESEEESNNDDDEEEDDSGEKEGLSPTDEIDGLDDGRLT